MKKIVRVKPVDGRRVKNPVSGSLVPERGIRVVLTSYWSRRIKDGSIEIIEPVLEPQQPVSYRKNNISSKRLKKGRK